MPKKVLIIGHNDGPQFIDIYNQYTQIFLDQEYAVTVATLVGAKQEHISAKLLAQHKIFFNFSKRHIRALKIYPMLKLLKLCAAEKFDMVICHRYKPSYIMMLVGMILNFKAMIFVMHELGTMKSLARRAFIRCCFKKNYLFAGVSNAVRDDMRKDLSFLMREKIVTLYNVIDVPLIEPQLHSRALARAELQLQPQDFVFGNLARLVKNKDHVSLLTAFAAIATQCPNAKVIIMGSGDLEDSLRALARELKISNKIIFSGFLQNAFRYMPAFDCFVLSSIQEAFGRVLLEAMIAKLPIIATRVHGIPEVMGKVGTLVEAKNITQLSAAMLKIYHSDEHQRQQEGQLAFLHAQTNFSLQSFTKDFWAIASLKHF